MAIQVGQQAPDFTLISDEKKPVKFHKNNYSELNRYKNDPKNGLEKITVH